MNIYLVQHAQAKSKAEDPQRSLTAKGLEDISRMATFAAQNCGIAGTAVYHSGKLRARQTADILAEHLHLPVPEQADGLEPLADPLIWAARLAEEKADLMLVGHLPHLGGLAAALLCNEPEKNAVHFQMGGIVALKGEGGLWSVNWMLIPDILPA